MVEKPRILILMYHSVSDSGEYRELPPDCRPFGYRVGVRDLQDHLEILQEEGCTTILLQDLAEAREGRARLPSRPVILTFDDGYEDNFSRVFPLLCSAGCRAAFFLSVSHLGCPGMLTWEEASRLAAAGMEIGSHGMNHGLLRGKSEAELRWELEESRRRLEERLGVEPQYFSLPRGYLPRALPRLALQVGYRGLCTSRPGFNNLRTSPFRLRRFAVRSGISPADFRALISGRGWRYSRLYLSEAVRDLARLRHYRPGREGQ